MFTSSFRIEIEKISLWSWDYLRDIKDAMTCRFIFKGKDHFHEEIKWVSCYDIFKRFELLLDYGDSRVPSGIGGGFFDISLFNKEYIKFFVIFSSTYNKKFEDIYYSFITSIPIEDFASAIKDFYDNLVKQMDERGVGPPEEREKFIKEYEPIFKKYEEWKKK